MEVRKGLGEKVVLHSPKETSIGGGDQVGREGAW